LPDEGLLGEFGEGLGIQFAFAAAAFRVRHAAVLDTVGLSPSRLVALIYLDRNGGQDQSSMSRALGINRASAMALVNRFEKEGLLRRGKRPGRKRPGLYLTDHGVSQLARALRLDDRFNQAMFGWLKGDERSSFIATTLEIKRRALVPLARLKTGEEISEET
jgi:DNA-binding MarR family transcriptional regulator